MPVWIAILELAALLPAAVIGFVLGRSSRTEIRYDEIDGGDV